jgi:hypothetical protein
MQRFCIDTPTEKTDEGMCFTAGICVAEDGVNDGDMWWDRIEVHGETAEQAEALRDQILAALER